MSNVKSMSTKEAWKMAFELSEQGASHARIASALHKLGYVSYKTGRKVLPTSVGLMISRYKKGVIPQEKVRLPKDDRPAKKKARPAARVFKAPLVTRTNKWDIAKVIDDSDCFSESTKRALIEIIISEAK